jgi:hypothetical protein
MSEQTTDPVESSNGNDNDSEEVNGATTTEKTMETVVEKQQQQQLQQQQQFLQQSPPAAKLFKTAMSRAVQGTGSKLTLAMKGTTTKVRAAVANRGTSTNNKSVASYGKVLQKFGKKERLDPELTPQNRRDDTVVPVREGDGLHSTKNKYDDENMMATTTKSNHNEQPPPLNLDPPNDTQQTDPNVMVTLGPVLEFVTADTTLFFIFTLGAALYPTYEYWDILFSCTDSHDNSTTCAIAAVAPAVILTKVGVPWMVAAFALGLAIGQYLDDYYRWFLPKVKLQSNTTQPDAGIRDDDVDSRLYYDAYGSNVVSDNDNDGVVGELVKLPQQQQKDTSALKNHSLFTSLLGTNRSSRIKFQHGTSKLIPHPIKTWTALNNKPSTTVATTATATTTVPHRSFRLPWQRNMHPTEDGYLMQHLLKHESFRRIRKSAIVLTATRNVATTTSTADGEDTSNDVFVLPVEESKDQHLGSFDLSVNVPDSLDGFVIEPILKLRGMDVFLTDDPEMEASTHPWLVQQGLRSIPTFTVNVLTQWGNILIYFEMPAWVRSFNHVEEESDPDDVKALKVCLF